MTFPTEWKNNKKCSKPPTRSYGFPMVFHVPNHRINGAELPAKNGKIIPSGRWTPDQPSHVFCPFKSGWKKKHAL